MKIGSRLPAKAAKPLSKGKRKAVVQTTNDNKLLAFLQGALKTNEPTVMTGAAMANGSGMPLGSVGLSLKKIIATGAVKLVGRGAYQLGSAAAVPFVATPVVKRTPAKKAKPVVAKKAKAANAVAPAAVDVKSKTI